MPAGLDAPGRSCLVRYWLLRQVRTYNLYVELLRRVTAVAGSALGGLGLGIGSSMMVNGFRPDGTSTTGLAAAGLVLGAGVGLVLAAMIRDRAKQ